MLSCAPPCVPLHSASSRLYAPLPLLDPAVLLLVSAAQRAAPMLALGPVHRWRWLCAALPVRGALPARTGVETRSLEGGLVLAAFLALFAMRLRGLLVVRICASYVHDDVHDDVNVCVDVVVRVYGFFCVNICGGVFVARVRGFVVVVVVVVKLHTFVAAKIRVLVALRLHALVALKLRGFFAATLHILAALLPLVGLRPVDIFCAFLIRDLHIPKAWGGRSRSP